MSGVCFEFVRTYLSDIDADRRAELAVPSGKFTFTFTEPSKLSTEQMATWQGLMVQNGETNIDKYFESVKASISQLAQNIPFNKQFSTFTLLGLNRGPGRSSSGLSIYNIWCSDSGIYLETNT